MVRMFSKGKNSLSSVMTGHQNRQKHVFLNIIFYIENCGLRNSNHPKGSEKEKGSFSFTLWLQ